MKRLVKEIFIFFILMVILALVIHPELRVDAIGHWKKLLNGANNLYHPLFWALGAYMIIGVLRLIISFISNFFELAKKKK